MSGTDDLTGPVDFTLSQEIAAPRARVHALLCDLDALAPLHPLIVSIEELPPPEERPAARRYRVTDRIPFGPFTLRTRYVAALESLGEDCVRGDAWQAPRVRLRTLYLLEADGPEATRLREEVRVQAPLGLNGMRSVTR